MKPYSERTPDLQYRNLLQEILKRGERTKSQQEVDAITLMAPNPMHFKLDNGFPLITERNMAPKISENLPVTVWQQAIAEICSFINGGRTLADLEKFMKI